MRCWDSLGDTRPGLLSPVRPGRRPQPRHGGGRRRRARAAGGAWMAPTIPEGSSVKLTTQPSPTRPGFYNKPVQIASGPDATAFFFVPRKDSLWEEEVSFAQQTARGVSIENSENEHVWSPCIRDMLLSGVSGGHPSLCIQRWHINANGDAWRLIGTTTVDLACSTRRFSENHLCGAKELFARPRKFFRISPPSL